MKLKFVSDDEDYGTGFSITYTALTPALLPGKLKASHVPAYTLGWGAGETCQGKTNQRKVFLWGWCFHGGALREAAEAKNTSWRIALGFAMHSSWILKELLVFLFWQHFQLLLSFPFLSAWFPDAGCESLAVLFEEGVLESMHYPEHYSNLAVCQWVICAPEEHVVKVEHESFLCLHDGNGHRWANKKLCS